MLQGAAAGPRGGSALDGLPALSLFVPGALSQCVGSALAVLLFASVPAAAVAWVRILAGGWGARRVAATVAHALDTGTPAARRRARADARADERASTWRSSGCRSARGGA